MEKVSVFIKIRVLFWPEISALGVFFYFDSERMRLPKYPSAPPPPPPGCSHIRRRQEFYLPKALTHKKIDRLIDSRYIYR